MKKFPEGFLWGASTSAMQVEGGIVGSDWSVADSKGAVPPIGKACDFYNRYEEDFDIAKSLNLNTFRFSVEWARIEPKEGKFDEKELEHYKAVVRALKARGLEPFVTIWHFSLPEWFSKSGSFGRRDAPKLFARYASKVAEALGEDAEFYITINEPLVWLGEQGVTVNSSPGMFPNPFNYFYFWKQLVRAHKAAYTAIKKANPHAQIGVAKHQFSAVGTGFFGNLVAKAFLLFWNRMFLNSLVGFQDFVGVQFYQQLFFWQSKPERTAALRSDIGWQIHPEAIYDTLKEAGRYGLPVFVSESGIADAKDQYRESFIKTSLEAVHKALEEGVDVRGYLYWSLLDNYEFTHGYTMRFGLVGVDHAGDQARTIRESARAYAEICKNNALE